MRRTCHLPPAAAERPGDRRHGWKRTEVTAGNESPIEAGQWMVPTLKAGQSLLQVLFS